METSISNPESLGYTFECDQILTIEEEEIAVHCTELMKPDIGSISVVVVVTETGNLANRLMDNPNLFNGGKLRCLYGGSESITTLGILTKIEWHPDPHRMTVILTCRNINCDNAPGDSWEFLLPFVKFGKGDHFTRGETGNGARAITPDQIKFTVTSNEWTLRTLIEIDGVLHPADQAVRIQKEAGVKKFDLTPSLHSVLQVSASGISREEAEKTAKNICWLLNIAFAQRVAWNEMGTRTGNTYRMLFWHAAAIADKPSVGQPIQNKSDEVLREFIQNAYPKFQEDSQWWAVTLNWFSIAAENSALEMSAMTYCMLFDRISTRLLKNVNFPKQIGEDLHIILNQKKSRKKLVKDITELLGKSSPAWDDKRSENLVQKIREWNDSPSYPKKIAVAFKKANLNPPQKEVLDHRHALMHEGKMELDSAKALEFLGEIRQQVTVLLFAMLGYNGKFFSMGRGECGMNDFMLEEPESTEAVVPQVQKPQPKSVCLGLFLLL